ncbi:SRPBCC domain-containing protein [Chryseobacterium oranimense]|uniref:SRPBCC family protein n=1 Tax=Chryseobacterium oranimense TaxID=421058 RepID=UPI0021B0689D|nr:SRPBCC domain-containing protein [Chryseobacterium oranimense]UWX61228.1 SRPBCC domain-containing protein [Chryseobacterium oranimense]
MENYNNLVQLNTHPDNVFSALTNGIPFWWTEMFEGSSNEQDQSFTIHFGESIFKKFKVQELIPYKKVVWYVEDSLLNIPGLKNQKEWIGTTIIWEITESKSGTGLHLTHVGLHPDIECYEICTDGWKQFTASLKLYLETGRGNPFLNQEQSSTEVVS